MIIIHFYPSKANFMTICILNYQKSNYKLDIHIIEIMLYSDMDPFYHYLRQDSTQARTHASITELRSTKDTSDTNSWPDKNSGFCGTYGTRLHQPEPSIRWLINSIG